MKLRKLILSNFRGFEQLEIDFSKIKTTNNEALSKEIVVIAGVNGVGKSAVLQAISKTASYLLPEITKARGLTDSFSESDIHAGKLNMSISAVFETNNKLEILGNISRTQLSPTQADEIRKERESIRAAQRYVEKDSPENIEYTDRLRQLDELLQTDGDYFSWQADRERLQKELKSSNPLIVYYSTNRSLSRLPPRLPTIKPLTPASAYVNALKGTEISLNDFANWYRAAQEGRLGSKKFGQDLLKLLESVIQKMMPDSEFRNLQLVQSSRPYFTIEKRGSLLELEQLSDGERGLLALAFDLTRRLAITNPKARNPVETGTAIVLIDEVELHLHPTWQRQVLRRLSSTFKNCQFIVTTHSPQVIGQTKAENLRLIYSDEEGRISATIPNQSLGMDSSWILQNIMGTPARDYLTEQDLGAIFNAIDEENYPQARQLIDNLLQEIGDFPDLQEASSLLDRLELLEEYEED